MKTSDQPIVVEQELAASPARIWSSLTVLEEMHLWYFDNIPAFQAEVGFETQFTLTNEGREFLHIWKVIEVIPNKKLVVNWTFGGYPGSSNVHFDIVHHDNQTKIILSTEVLENYPEDIPEFRRESAVGGWNYFIKDRLYNYLKAH